MSNFNNYAQYYDVFYADKNYAKESKYVESLIKRYTQTEVKDLLDVGCGTGSHLANLVSTYNCTGIDLSSEMLDIAKNKYGSQIRFIQSSSEDIDFKGEFDVVTALFHVVSYWATNKSLLESFRNIHNSLRKGGFFIFDYWYGPAVLKLKPENRHYVKTKGDMRVIKLVSSELREAQNQVSVNFEIFLDRSPSDSTAFTENHLMRYYSIPELEIIAQSCGFEVENHFAWMKSSLPSSDEWSGVSVFRKS